MTRSGWRLALETFAGIAIVLIVALALAFLWDRTVARWQQKAVIENSFDKAVARYRNRRHYTPQTRAIITGILYRAERELNLSHRKVLSVWMLESEMNPYCTNWNAHSYDSGLGQINNYTLNWLAQVTGKRLYRLGLERYRYMFRATPSPYNVVANALMSVTYLSILQEQYGVGYNSVISYNRGRPPVKFVNFPYWQVYLRNLRYMKSI